MSQEDISCQATAGCQGHAMLPGGALLIIDGKRHCWGCGAKSKTQKDKCIRVPLCEIQTALDLLNKGINALSYGGDEPGAVRGRPPESITMAHQILQELLEQKGATDG